MDTSSLTMFQSEENDTDANDPDVSALEKEMEEITGQAPDSCSGQDQEETQILGDLDVDSDNARVLAAAAAAAEGGSVSNTNINENRIINKFVVQNEQDGVVYYIVENADPDNPTAGFENHTNEEGQEGEIHHLQFVEEGHENINQNELNSGEGGEGQVNNIQSHEESHEDMDTMETGEYAPGEVTDDGQEDSSTDVKVVKVEPGVSQGPKISLVTSSPIEMKSSGSSQKEPIDLEPLWEEPACIVCNTTMKIDDPKNLNLGSVELKTFYAKMMGLGEHLNLEQETTYPFCNPCTDDVAQLKAIAHKIDFMHRQFDKIRDNLARKTIKTFLERKEPDLVKRDEEEKAKNANYETLNRNNLNDTIYNRWKTRYELNFPGPKCPLIIKTMDSKGRTTVVRMNPEDSKDVLKHLPVAKYNSTTIKQSIKDVRRAPVLKLGDHEAAGTDNMNRGDYKCKDCHKSFCTSNMLAYHSRIHSGELPFECELCGKGFAVPHYLMIHMRSHTGEKPYKCEVCGKGFAQRGGLVTHNLVHSGDKPFVCSECGKSFRQKYHLTQHLLIHSGAKPFGCEICGKFFNVKMNLREHMRRHTGDRPYKCPYCVIIGFFRKKMLRDHIVKSHPSKQLPGELENLSESTRPAASTKRNSPDPADVADDEEYVPTNKKRRKVKVKQESDSEADAEEYSPSPSPPHVDLEEDETEGNAEPMDKIVEETSEGV